MTDECLTYLNGRGLYIETVRNFRLGFTGDPQGNHPKGRLCIPVIKKDTVVGMKFRCIQEHTCKASGCVKYLNDGVQWLFNTNDIDRDSDVIAICEGEIDCMTLSGEVGIPAVGVPGVDAWKGHPHWVEVLRDHRKVLIFADNDSFSEKNYGMELGKRILRDLPRSRLILLPDGGDVNSVFLDYGPAKLRELGGLESSYAIAA